MNTPNVIFFGCDSTPGHSNPGHYVTDKRDRKLSYWNQPFQNEESLDGALLKEAGVPDRVDGRCIVVRRHGWTVVAFWDRSGDSRGASNTAFMVKGDVPADEILAAAREQWPEIFTRPNFPNLQLPCLDQGKTTMNLPTKEAIKSIYAGIERREGLTSNLEGWNSGTPIFPEVIFQTQPRVIIEVGVWNGPSLINMASICKQKQLDTVLFGVDVFYGRACDHIGHLPPDMIPERWTSPSRYEQFLYNVKKAGHDDCIIPVCNFTKWGARMLGTWGVVADLIYVDAGHDEEFVYADFVAYWPLLRSGGIMFFDDLGYPGVVAAIGRFGQRHVLSLNIVGGQGYFRKP